MSGPSLSELCTSIESGDARAAFVLCERMRARRLRALLTLARFAMKLASPQVAYRMFDALVDGFDLWRQLDEIHALEAREPNRVLRAV